MEKSRRCDICIIDVHRESFPKHLRSKNHEKISEFIPLTPLMN